VTLLLWFSGLFAGFSKTLPRIWLPRRSSSRYSPDPECCFRWRLPPAPAKLRRSLPRRLPQPVADGIFSWPISRADQGDAFTRSRTREQYRNIYFPAVAPNGSFRYRPAPQIGCGRKNRRGSAQRDNGWSGPCEPTRTADPLPRVPHPEQGRPKWLFTSIC
jgi:hypothetical protein